MIAVINAYLIVMETLKRSSAVFCRLGLHGPNAQKAFMVSMASTAGMGGAKIDYAFQSYSTVKGAWSLNRCSL